jgi:hypothetical protein
VCVLLPQQFVSEPADAEYGSELQKSTCDHLGVPAEYRADFWAEEGCRSLEESNRRVDKEEERNLVQRITFGIQSLHPIQRSSFLQRCTIVREVWAVQVCECCDV